MTHRIDWDDDRDETMHGRSQEQMSKQREGWHDRIERQDRKRVERLSRRAERQKAREF